MTYVEKILRSEQGSFDDFSRQIQDIVENLKKDLAKLQNELGKIN